MAEQDKYPGADAFGAAFNEAVEGDKDLQSAPAGDKMREDPPEMINRPEPPSEEANTLREAAQAADEAAKDEYWKSWNSTKDVKPPKADKPEFGSFREAFAWHRANGDKTFKWTNKAGTTDEYSTKLAPAEKPPAVAAEKPPAVAAPSRGLGVDVPTGDVAPAQGKKRGMVGRMMDNMRAKDAPLNDAIIRSAKAAAAQRAEDKARRDRPQPATSTLTPKRKVLDMTNVDPKTLLPRRT